MKPRHGERRVRPRFDVVGLLVGSLEGWPSHSVHDISEGGALVESTCALPLGMRISGGVSIGSQHVPIRATVRRVMRFGGTPTRNAVGVEWDEQDAFPVSEVAAGWLPRAARPEEHGVERRRRPRFMATGPVQLDHSVVSSIVVLDISGSGVLFVSPIPIPVGTHAQLRLRLGGADFLGDMVIRRLDVHEDPRKGWRLGARFGTLDEISRKGLHGLLERQTGV